MKAVIDTSSLLSLVRYYLPFDEHSVLLNFIRSKIESADLLVVDAVLEECKYTAGRLVLDNLPFLTDATFLRGAGVPYSTQALLAPAPAKFVRQLDSQFVNTVIRKTRRITDTEYENQKAKFLESADMRQVVLCLNLLRDGERVVLVSEETEGSNDNKLFKKIPAICKLLNIESITLPTYLKGGQGISLEFR